MVPDKFNMVDMEGIDIITSQGEVVEGLYQKLVESIAQCRYQCLYNWKFDGILIPPTYVEMDIEDDVVWINEGVCVDEEDVVRVYSLEPPAPEPNILELSVTENGTYTVPEGYDGYNPVSVSVPIPQPVLNSLSVTENGTYTPPTGVDGFNEVEVNVPSSGQPAPLLYWDLSESIYDEIDNLPVSLAGGAEENTGGIYLPSASSQIVLPSVIKPLGVIFEIELGATEAVLGSSHLRFFVSNINSWNSGLIYRSTGEWSFYSGSTWDNGSGITDINFFSNSIVKIVIDYAGKWKIYKNNSLVYSPTIALSNLTNALSIGSTAQSYFPALVKSIKVY